MRAGAVLPLDGETPDIHMLALLHELSGLGLALAVMAGLVLAVIGIFIAIDKGQGGP